MLNRKSILIFVGILMAAYIGAYFVISSKLEDFISQKFEIEHDRIVKSGFPFNITFNIKDHDLYKSLSFNIPTKKLEISLKSIPGKLNDIKHKNYNWKYFDHLIFSAKIESYFKSIPALFRGATAMDHFNLTNDYNLHMKGAISDPDLLIDTNISLSFPKKRHYENFDDILSDLPRHFVANVKHNVDADKQADMHSFLRKISDATYPQRSEFSLECHSLEKLELKGLDLLSAAKVLMNLNVNFTGKTDLKTTKSRANLNLHVKNKVFYADLKASEQYKEDALKSLYNILSKEDISEFVLFAMQNMGIQPSDNIKGKITALTDLTWDRMEAKIAEDPKYWEKFYNLKANYLASLALPLEGSDSDLEFLLHIPNDSGEFEMKIDGLMKNGLKGDTLTGQLFVSDKNNNIAEIMGYLRLAKFAFDKTIDLNQFNQAVKAFDADINLINSTLSSFSDEPDGDDLKYTYNVNIAKPEISTINNRGNNAMEFVMLNILIFDNPNINITNLDQAMQNSGELNDPLEPKMEGEDL